jgi:cytochrome P450
MTECLWDPTDPDHRADPYPRYEVLRRTAPVWWSPQGYWVLSRHADISAALLDDRLTSHDPTDNVRVAPPGPDVVPPVGERAARFFSNWMTFSPTEADHRRLRRLMMAGFTPARMVDFAPRLERAVDQVIEPLRDRDGFDFMADVAEPLPVIAICEVLGVPAELRDVMHRLARPLARAFHAVPLTHAEMTELDATIEAFQNAIMGLIEELHRAPNGTFLSDLAERETAGDLSEDELIAGMANMFFGGHHTSVLYYGNGMLSLLRHPGQADLLRQRAGDPQLTADAAEELLRYDSPAQTGAARFAAEDMVLHDQKILAGDKVLMLLGSANRDPDTYERPDELDLERSDLRTLALGRGGHSCIGAPLARLEGQVAFPRLVQAFPNLTLAETVIQYGEHSLFRGPQRLLVSTA